MFATHLVARVNDVLEEHGTHVEQVSYSVSDDIVILENSGVKLRFRDTTYNVTRLIVSKDELEQVRKENPTVKFVLRDN